MEQEQAIFMHGGKTFARGAALVRTGANVRYREVLHKKLDAERRETHDLRAAVAQECERINERICKIALRYPPVGSLYTPTDFLEPPPEDDEQCMAGAAETQRIEAAQHTEIYSRFARASRALQEHEKILKGIWHNGTPRDIADEVAFCAEAVQLDRHIHRAGIPLIKIFFRRSLEDMLEKIVNVADAIERRVRSGDTPSGTLGKIGVQLQTRAALEELRSLVGEVNGFLDAPHEHKVKLESALDAAKARVKRANEELGRHRPPGEFKLPATSETGQRLGQGAKKGLRRAHEAKVKARTDAAKEVKKSGMNLRQVDQQLATQIDMIHEKNYAELYGNPEMTQKCDLLMRKLSDALARFLCIREERPSGDPADAYPDEFSRSMRETKEARVAEVSAALDRMIDAHTQCVVEFLAAGKDARWDAIMETVTKRTGLTAVDFNRVTHQIIEECPDVARRVVEGLTHRYCDEHHTAISAFRAVTGPTERILDDLNTVCTADQEKVREYAAQTWKSPLHLHLLMSMLVDTEGHWMSGTYAKCVEELAQMPCCLEDTDPPKAPRGTTHSYVWGNIKDIAPRSITVREHLLRKFGKVFSRFIPVRGWKDRFEKWTGADV